MHCDDRVVLRLVETTVSSYPREEADGVKNTLRVNFDCFEMPKEVVKQKLKEIAEATGCIIIEDEDYPLSVAIRKAKQSLRIG